MSHPQLDPNCYNCNHPIELDEKYCAKCGQKHHDGKYSVGEVISEFISANFNIDAKIFKTILGLFRPGFLTIQYFKGIHKQYYKPVRLFLVLGIIVFAVLGPEVNSEPGYIEELNKNQIKNEYEAKWDSLRSVIKTNTNEGGLAIDLDTLFLTPQLASHNTDGTIDSLLPDGLQNEDNDFQISIAGNKVAFNASKDSIKIEGKYIPTKELLNKPPKEIIQKHFANASWYKKIGLTQLLKLAVDQNSLVSFLINRLPIFLLLLTPMYAFIFWLLYIRGKKFFVEHFVFVLHLNSAALLLILIFYGLSELFQSDLILASIVPIYFAYFFIALKRYYQQSFGKTFLKFILVNIASPLVGSFALVIILLLSFLLF